MGQTAHIFKVVVSESFIIQLSCIYVYKLCLKWSHLNQKWLTRGQGPYLSLYIAILQEHWVKQKCSYRSTFWILQIRNTVKKKKIQVFGFRTWCIYKQLIFIMGKMKIKNFWPAIFSMNLIKFAGLKVLNFQKYYNERL